MAYHVSLQSFDGPLDLLLQLVMRTQVDIRDIFVSDITEQFLRHVAEMDVSMDKSGEFLEMAARLMEIKSRRLLPNAQEDEELVDMSEELIRQLEEYRRYKWVSNELKRREEEGRDYYYRLPQEFVEGELVIRNASAQLLYNAFLRLLEKSKEETVAAPGEVERDNFTVQEQMLLIRSRLALGPFSFVSLFSSAPVRAELVTTFLALLEMVKEGEISVQQDAVFTDIIISPAEVNAHEQD